MLAHTRAACLVPVIVVSLSALACSHPQEYTQDWLKPLDKSTEYHIAEQPGGFRLIIRHQKYQYRAEDDALRADCVRTFYAAAHILAEQRRRAVALQSIQGLEMSTGRNIFSGISSCTAKGTISYTR